MISFLSKQTKVLFLEKNTTKIIPKGKISLILSPEFYWARFFELPVKSVSSALDILPALFEEFLPINDYSYQATKVNDNTFLCFAYNNDEIFNHIQKLKIPISHIKNIYFAQNEFQSYESFVLNETVFIYVNSILVKVPKNIAFKNAPIINNNFEELKLSKIKVGLKLYKSLIDKKYIYSLLVLLFLLSCVNIYKTLVYKQEINKNKKEVLSISKQYNLPSTMLQTNSIIKNYDKEIEKNIKLREQIKYLLSYKKIEKNIFFEKINTKAQSLIVRVKNTNKNKFKQYIEKQYPIKKVFFIKDSLEIELFL